MNRSGFDTFCGSIPGHLQQWRNGSCRLACSPLCNPAPMPPTHKANQGKPLRPEQQCSVLKRPAVSDRQQAGQQISCYSFHHFFLRGSSFAAQSAITRIPKTAPTIKEIKHNMIVVMRSPHNHTDVNWSLLCRNTMSD